MFVLGSDQAAFLAFQVGDACTFMPAGDGLIVRSQPSASAPMRAVLKARSKMAIIGCTVPVDDNGHTRWNFNRCDTVGRTVWAAENQDWYKPFPN